MKVLISVVLALFLMTYSVSADCKPRLFNRLVSALERVSDRNWSIDYPSAQIKLMVGSICVEVTEGGLLYISGRSVSPTFNYRLKKIYTRITKYRYKDKLMIDVLKALKKSDVL